MVALTLYPFILFAKTKEESHTDFDRETLKHEMVHVRQARAFRFPLFFYLLYVIFFLREAISWIVNGRFERSSKINFWLAWYQDAYNGNPYEVEAYDEEEHELNAEELDELMTAGAINFRCLKTGELRRACKLRGIPITSNGDRITKPKLRRLLEKHVGDEGLAT